MDKGRIIEIGNHDQLLAKTDSMRNFTTVSSRKPDKAVITAIVLIAVIFCPYTRKQLYGFSHTAVWLFTDYSSDSSFSYAYREEVLLPQEPL